MQFEKLKTPRFCPLDRREMILVKAGETSQGGTQQAGLPVRDDAHDCWIVRIRYYSSDSFENGQWCYQGEGYGYISTHVPPSS